ncbi:MAG: YihY/virulence factor BrkB family protein [Candidatus Dormibacterales bacterium]
MRPPTMIGRLGALGSRTSDRLLRTAPGRLATKMGEDGAFNWAVVIAWQFLQSLFPIALVMAGVLGVVLGYVGVTSHEVYRTVASIIPDAGAQRQVLAALSTFHQQSGAFFVVGFVVLVWSGAGLFRAMENGFAAIYRTRSRSLGKSVFMSVGMVFLLVVLGGVMLLSTTFLSLPSDLPYLPDLLAHRAIDVALHAALGAGVGFLLFLAIYIVVPNRRDRFAAVWPGAALAGVLFEALSLSFPLYVRLTRTGATYGKTFGLLFLLMLYFYGLGIVTMIGAEVNSMRDKSASVQPVGRKA